MKPGLLFLNVIRIKQETTGDPLAPRNVQGEGKGQGLHSLPQFGTWNSLESSQIPFLGRPAMLLWSSPPNTPHTPMLDRAVPSTHITFPLEPTLTHCCSRSCHHLLHCIKDPRCQEFYFCAEASEGPWLLALPGIGQAFGKRILNWRGKEGFCWESGVQSFHCC